MKYNTKFVGKKLKIPPIIIGSGILNNIHKIFSLDQFSQIVILTDKNVSPHWLSAIHKGLLRQHVIDIIIPAGERLKTIEEAKVLWKKMFEQGVDTRSLLINLGGGVIGDLGAFVASTFMRGFDFLQIPTSLLAQVDASVGGKIGLNFEGIKNGIGLFNNPIGTIIDIKTLTTLPKRELVSGFSEAIKHGIIADKEYFNLVTSKKPGEFTLAELEIIVKQSVKIKLNVVSKDYKDTGSRRILNFGHTIGHAIESLSLRTDKPFTHGEALAVGMRTESKLSHLLGLLSNKDFMTIEKVLNYTGLPIAVQDITSSEIVKMIAFDKKRFKRSILWSLPTKIGHAVFDVKLPNDKLVFRAIEYIHVPFC